MGSVVVSPRAEDDLREIWLTIALDSPSAADRVVRNIGARLEHLASFPDMGVQRPELAPTARMLVEGNYLILYEPAPGGVEIVRVLHGARSLPDLF